jgi:uncharacterized OB-fold protein
MDITKPIPETASHHEEEFWQLVTEETVCVQHCAACGHNAYPPRLVCPNCYADEWDFQEIDGTGEVYGYTAIHRPSRPQYDDEVPIVSAIVDLPEGPRMMGAVDCDIDDIEVGMTVELRTSNLSNEDVRFIFDLL